jgi:hypothetical protein
MKRFVIFPIIVGLLLLANAGYGASLNLCAQALKPSASTIEAVNLSQYLTSYEGTSDLATVKAVGWRDGKVIFEKDKRGLWVSRHDAIPNTLTAEGDIRLPIFLFGTKLAAKLGYAIRELSPDKIEIGVPDADTLASKIAKANANLKARGLEPITYLPVRAGLVTIREIQAMMLSAQGDFNIYFPYADKDLNLVSHEASFHLGSILLNKKITSRAREVTQETANLLAMIEERAADVGPLAKRLMGQIRIERNFEMDAGLASMVTSPGFSRRDHGMKSYKEINPLISERYRSYMIRNIEFIARPRLQPYEAVLTRLQLITGVDVSDLIHHDNSNFLAMTLERAKVGTKVVLEEREKLALRKIAVSYASRQRTNFQTGPPQDWLNEFLQQLDQRIQDIEDSLE